MRKLRNIRSLGGPRSVATVPWEKRRLAASSARWALGGPRCCAADHFAAGFASSFFAAGLAAGFFAAGFASPFFASAFAAGL